MGRMRFKPRKSDSGASPPTPHTPLSQLEGFMLPLCVLFRSDLGPNLINRTVQAHFLRFVLDTGILIFRLLSSACNYHLFQIYNTKVGIIAIIIVCDISQ